MPAIWPASSFSLIVRRAQRSPSLSTGPTVMSRKFSSRSSSSASASLSSLISAPRVSIKIARQSRVGSGETGPQGALHVNAEPIEEPEPTARARELAREYRAVIETVLEHRGAGRLVDVLAGVDDPSQLADTAAYSPDLTMEQRVQLLETIDVEERLELALVWGREVLADLELKDKIRSEVSDDGTTTDASALAIFASGNLFRNDGAPRFRSIAARRSDQSSPTIPG